MKQEVKYVGYRHFRGGNTIEKIVFSLLNEGGNVTVQVTGAEYFASSFSDDEVGIIVSGMGEFICAFFIDPNFCDNDFLLGVWAECSSTSGNMYKSGRILLGQVRDELELYPNYLEYDEQGDAIGNAINDISTIYFVRKFCNYTAAFGDKELRKKC